MIVSESSSVQVNTLTSRQEIIYSLFVYVHYKNNKLLTCKELMGIIKQHRTAQKIAESEAQK